MTDRFLVVLAFILTTACAAGAQSVSTPPVPLVPTIAIDLSDAGVSPGARRIIRNEMQRIWGAHGIRLDWPTSTSGLSNECAAVKVVFTDTESGLRRAPGRRPLGVVYRVGQILRRAIFVSPAAVLSLVRKSSPGPHDSLLVARLHARMMARVIAHELGHILLGSEGHSPRGLMRGRFIALDVRRDGLEHFALDPHESRHVARRCQTATVALATR